MPYTESIDQRLFCYTVAFAFVPRLLPPRDLIFLRSTPKLGIYFHELYTYQLSHFGLVRVYGNRLTFSHSFTSKIDLR